MLLVRQIVLLLSIALMFVASAQTENSSERKEQTKSPELGVARNDAEKLAAQLTSMQADITKLVSKAAKPDYMPALIGVIGVLVGSVISAIMSLCLIAHQRRLAREAAVQSTQLAERRAVFETRNAFAQWQLKQLSELYGPLHALLRQSNALYRHMNAVLISADPDKFRLREGGAGEDFDRQVFEIFLGGAWTRFRTIMHITQVYGKGYHIEAYFDGIVDIGSRMVKIIAENAGYARPDQNELVAVFGRYLAHFSVLGKLHKQIKDLVKASKLGSETPMATDQSAVFPKEIQGHVDRGFEAINTDLMKWQGTGNMRE